MSLFVAPCQTKFRRRVRVRPFRFAGAPKLSAVDPNFTLGASRLASAPVELYYSKE
jgi:hypothetical protein